MSLNRREILDTEQLDKIYQGVQGHGMVIPRPARTGPEVDGDINAVVTGGAGGIGFATGTLLAMSGVNVFLLDQNAQALGVVGTFLRNNGLNITTIVADITDPTTWLNQLPKSVDIFVANAGRIDGQVDPAIYGLRGAHALREPTLEDAMDMVGTEDGRGWLMDDHRLTYEVNLLGHQIMVYEVLRGMRERARRAGALFNKSMVKENKRRFGAVVLTGSVNVQTLNADRLGYVPIKAAIEKQVPQLAKHVAKYGITVNGVAPGATADTSIVRNAASAGERMSLGINYPVDVANATNFLTHTVYARNITGQVIVVDGARSL